ncbi:MAG: hypothetical protein B7Z16_18765, partial [Algoriphagus sp. 32-45-6]
DDPVQDHAPPEEGGGWGPVAVVAAVLVLVLAWAALVVWLRRPALYFLIQITEKIALDLFKY